MSGLRYFVSFLAAVLRQWGVIVTGGVIVGAIALYEHFSGRSLAGWPLKIAIGLSLFVAVFFAWRKERQRWESVNDAATFSATPAELVGVFHGRTTGQGEILAHGFRGRRLTVSGSINDISRNLFSNFFHPRYDVHLESQPVLILEFIGRKMVKSIFALSKGDAITARGKIEYVSSNHLRLTNCELIKIEPRS